MNVVLVVHSIVRWVIVLLGVIGAVRYALVMTKRAPSNNMDRGLMAGYTGLLDLNVLLGFIYLLWSGLATPIGFPVVRIEHAVTNIIGVGVAHMFARRGKKIGDAQSKARSYLLGIVLSLAIIVVGVTLVNGWVR
jgi:hypothetical protein